MVRHEPRQSTGVFVSSKETVSAWTPEQLEEAKRKAEEDRWKNKSKRCNCK
jgi:hypothetical protein